MSVDAVTAFFEVGAACIGWQNVYRVYKDKEVKGLWAPGTVFFLAWALWSLFMYSHFVMWWSLAALLARIGANIAWLSLVWYYRRRKTGAIQQTGEQVNG